MSKFGEVCIIIERNCFDPNLACKMAKDIFNALGLDTQTGEPKTVQVRGMPLPLDQFMLASSEAHHVDTTNERRFSYPEIDIKKHLGPLGES